MCREARAKRSSDMETIHWREVTWMKNVTENIVRSRDVHL